MGEPGKGIELEDGGVGWHTRARPSPANRETVSMTSLRRFFPLMLVIIGLATCTIAFIQLRQAAVEPTSADADDPELVARGDRVYAAECAGCHGAHLEG